MGSELAALSIRYTRLFFTAFTSGKGGVVRKVGNRIRKIIHVGQDDIRIRRHGGFGSDRNPALLVSKYVDSTDQLDHLVEEGARTEAVQRRGVRDGKQDAPLIGDGLADGSNLIDGGLHVVVEFFTLGAFADAVRVN